MLDIKPRKINKSIKVIKKNKAVRFVAAGGVLLLVVVVVLNLVLEKPKKVSAQMVSFYSNSCLGGWKNTQKAIGAPDIRDLSDGKYTDENSASIDNAVTQIYCGGFKGVLPEDTIQKKIELKFSWATEEQNNNRKEKEQEDLELKSSEDAAVSTAEATSTKESGSLIDAIINIIAPPVETYIAPTEEMAPGQQAPEAPTEQPKEEPTSPEVNIVPPAPDVQEASAPEPAPAAGDQSFIDRLFSKAYAQELVGAETVDTPLASSSATSTLVVDETPKAIFEVRFTLDGVTWKSLGYVFSVNNQVSFDIPLDSIANASDLEKMQVAVETVSTYDLVPKIYLDSMWIEVEYQNLGEETFVAPGDRDGDIVLADIPYEHRGVRLVKRKDNSVKEGEVLELWLYEEALEGIKPEEGVDSTQKIEIAISDVVKLATSTGEKLAEAIGVAGETQENFSSTAVATTTRVEKKPKFFWKQITDNTNLSDNSIVNYVDGSVFWLGKDTKTIWRYNPASDSYESMSLSEGSYTLEYLGQATEHKSVTYSPETNSFKFSVVK